ncbi:MAG: hypothetical protein MI975_21395 [Cytophagales bacterium]|nr:hypothetical protein [Cytophagales bacterium]
MKHIFSISLILIYLVGTFQSSWVLVDFYWNREDYTQKYCQFLDEGITQCRASCYLDNLLEEQHNKTSSEKITASREIKISQIANDNLATLNDVFGFQKRASCDIPERYHFDYLPFIFRPPQT